MTKRILLFLSLSLLLAGNVHAQQVEWKTIEQAAKTDSKTNAKLYFVDFYTSWCGWCKKMDRDTFSDPTVAKILNKYFYPVKFNAESSDYIDKNGRKRYDTELRCYGLAVITRQSMQPQYMPQPPYTYGFPTNCSA